MDDERWGITKRSKCRQGTTKWQQTITRASKKDIQNTKGTSLHMKFPFLCSKGHQDVEG
jgi:hypothetical protein